MMKKRSVVYILIAGAVLSISVFAAVKRSGMAAGDALSPQVRFTEVRGDPQNYSFINPLLFLRSNKGLYAQEFQPLNDAVTDYLTSVLGADATNTVSVYFNDLDTGHWTGLNEATLYEPSSMLKVGVMVGYYKAAEQDPSLLDQELYYPGPDTKGQYYVPQDELAPGYHSVRELIGNMIRYSDNVALKTLTNADPNKYLRVAHDLQLPLPPSGPAVDYMSAQSYSRIFRVLYNSSYLNWDDSEKALRLMSYTTFTQGIGAGVPSNIIISHKFGEFTDYFGPNNTLVARELHDCGIVYDPGRPYFLCVMTRGTDFPALEKVIAGVSKTVFDYRKASADSSKL